jgi:hypothetical protein
MSFERLVSAGVTGVAGYQAVKRGAELASGLISHGRTAAAYGYDVCAYVGSTALAQKCGEIFASTSNWFASIPVGEKVVPFFTETAFPALSSYKDRIVSTVVENGENFTALQNIGPWNGAVLGVAISLIGTGIDIDNKLQESGDFFARHSFVSLVLGHAVAGAVVYVASAGLAAAGITAAAVTLPGAVALTANAIASSIAVKVAFYALAQVFKAAAYLGQKTVQGIANLVSAVASRCCPGVFNRFSFI